MKAGEYVRLDLAQVKLLSFQRFPQLKMDLSSVSFLILVTASSLLFGIGYSQLDGTFSVLDFGATGNGLTDDNQAFSTAWQRMCGAVGGTQTLRIPSGKVFLLKPLQFSGPCNSSNIVIQVDGTLVAPSSISEWTGYCQSQSQSWLFFSNVKGLVIQGSGLMDGKGSIWWPQPKAECGAPTSLKILYCDNLRLSGFSARNSPNKHILIHGSKGVSISDIHITAPEDSPNTDGIVLSGATQVNIADLVIRTGDDCIAIKAGSAFVNISGVFCGPGHGISVGSVGLKPDDKIEEIHVRNCNFYRAQNGARIKTIQGGSGYVRAISFKNVILQETRNPIIIDQGYKLADGSGATNVSDVTYIGIEGSSASEEGIILNCAERGCSNIVMDHVKINSSVPGQQIVSVCKNAKGRSTFTTPDVPCLSK